MNAEVLTVAELNRTARRLLEQHFPLLWIAGEISNLVRASSGHVYFTLKDAEAQVRCVMFRSRAQLLPWKLDNGQQVEVQALVTLYEARGDFQLNVEGMRRAGIGQLYERFLKLRDKLAAEGLFAAERKREIPRFPRRVGIVTSPQAAALRDVIATFARRAPHLELMIYPALVQGTEAPASLIGALNLAYARAECDLLLVVRGGGSIEDLWAFNDEALVRKLAQAPMSTLSGVGHETDTTLADYVADRRAATPTAAAELASAGWFAAAREIDDLNSRLSESMRATLEARMQMLDRLALRLVHPGQRLAAHRQKLDLLDHRMRAALRPLIQQHPRLDRLAERLHQTLNGQFARLRQDLARQQGALAALSPLATLERGYSIVRDADGRILRSAAHLAPDDVLALQFSEGSAQARVIGKTL